jgi:hypothetical protein
LHRGTAVQVDPIKPTLNALGTQSVKLNCCQPLSSFAFKFNLRRCIVEDSELLRTDEPFIFRYLYHEKQATCLQYFPAAYPAPAAAALKQARNLRQNLSDIARHVIGCRLNE